MNSPRPSFSYVFDVRDCPRGPFSGSVTEAFGECFLGTAPELTWMEHTPAAWKLYAQVTLKASEKRGVAAAGISFVIDRGLMTVARPEVLLVSIERLKICPETSAHTSAQLMDRHGYRVVER